MIKNDEAQEAINFLKNINYEMPESLVRDFIIKIMRTAKIDVKDFMNVENLKFDNIDQANEYLQLIMNLHNNIPHYALYGYSPNELMKNQLEDLNDINNSEPEEVKKIREKLWSNTSIISDYIKDNPNNLDKQSLDIISEWNKKKINSKFILYKYENEYAVFIGEENIYYVKGLRDTIRNIIPEYKLPIFVETVLLPFKEQIIYDSYIIQYSMSFGTGMKDIFDKQYKEFIKLKKVKYKL